MQALVSQDLGSEYTGINRWIVRVMPSLTDLAFLLPILWLFLVMDGSAALLSDGDTGWHIRTGQWIWNHGAVPTQDIFSFTRPHEAWFAWEWLWDLLFAGVHHVGGLGAVAFANVCLLCALSALLFRLVRRSTDNDLISFAVAAVAMSGTNIHWLARPHLVSWLFVVLFLRVLLSVRNGNPKLLLCLPPCMLLWTNLHGSFFLGIVLLVLAAAGEVAGAFLHAYGFWDAAWHRSRYYLGCALACALVTFINPYGWQLHSHVISYLFDSRLLGMTAEYHSIAFGNPQAHAFECILMPGIAAVLWSILRRQYATALSLLVFGHLALLSARNIPLFLICAAAPVAYMVQDLLVRAQEARRLRVLGSELRDFAKRIRPLERAERLHIVSAVAVLLLAACFAGSLPGFAGQFNPKSFPVSALDTIKKARFARLFTTDQWADYFVYNLYPNQPSFLDGRGDYFGFAFAEQYLSILNARYDWEQNLDKYRVDSVALKPDLPVVSALKASHNWQLLFDDGAVVVFGRTPASGLLAVDVESPKVSPARLGREKKLGSTRPSLTVSNVKTQERRSS